MLTIKPHSVTFAVAALAIAAAWLSLGTISASASAPCPQLIVHRAGEPPQVPIEPYLWEVRADNISCESAASVIRQFFANPASAPNGWSCGATDAEAGCSRGSEAAFAVALHPIGKDCGAVSFKAHTDNASTSIRASHVSCRKAKKLVRAVYYGRGQMGFSCHSKVYTPIGLPYAHWVCTKGKKRVSWIKT